MTPEELTRLIETTVRRVFRQELAAVGRNLKRSREPCATPGCVKQTQTGSPFCSDCRHGRSPEWQHPRVKSRRAAPPAHLSPVSAPVSVKPPAAGADSAMEAA